MLTYGNKSFTWSSGRNLAQITDGDNTYSYTYDENGIRTSKTHSATAATTTITKWDTTISKAVIMIAIFAGLLMRIALIYLKYQKKLYLAITFLLIVIMMLLMMLIIMAFTVHIELNYMPTDGGIQETHQNIGLMIMIVQILYHSVFMLVIYLQ